MSYKPAMRGLVYICIFVIATFGLHLAVDLILEEKAENLDAKSSKKIPNDQGIALTLGNFLTAPSFTLKL
jgi:hypothetical protein